jgi:hypothetical protein
MGSPPVASIPVRIILPPIARRIYGTCGTTRSELRPLLFAPTAPCQNDAVIYIFRSDESRWHEQNRLRHDSAFSLSWAHGLLT